MTRPTLQNGDIWSDSLANAAGFPRLDGSDAYGAGPKVIDAWLDDSPDQIKARFYAWYDRLKVVAAVGLGVSVPGATAIRLNGQPVAVPTTALTLPANSTNYVFVNEAGAVSFGAALPPVGIPLAIAQTNATTVTSIIDLRQQVAEGIRSLSATDSNGFAIADMKESASAIADPGWVVCDWAMYDNLDYPIAAAKIGRQYSKAGDPAGTFRVPPGAGRVSVGVGTGEGLTPRAAGAMGGAESVALTESTSFRHSHNFNDPGHQHGATDQGHIHEVNDPSHGHPILGSYETSDGTVDSLIVEDTAVAGEQSGTKGYTTETNNNQGQRIILPQTTGVSVRSSRANIQIASARTGASVLPFGDSQPHENMPPFFTAHRYIRLF